MSRIVCRGDDARKHVGIAKGLLQRLRRLVDASVNSQRKQVLTVGEATITLMCGPNKRDDTALIATDDLLFMLCFYDPDTAPNGWNAEPDTALADIASFPAVSTEAGTVVDKAFTAFRNTDKGLVHTNAHAPVPAYSYQRTTQYGKRRAYGPAVPNGTRGSAFCPDGVGGWVFNAGKTIKRLLSLGAVWRDKPVACAVPGTSTVRASRIVLAAAEFRYGGAVDVSYDPTTSVYYSGNAVIQATVPYDSITNTYNAPGRYISPFALSERGQYAVVVRASGANGVLSVGGGHTGERAQALPSVITRALPDTISSTQDVDGGKVVTSVIESMDIDYLTVDFAYNDAGEEERVAWGTAVHTVITEYRKSTLAITDDEWLKIEQAAPVEYRTDVDEPYYAHPGLCPLYDPPLVGSGVRGDGVFWEYYHGGIDVVAFVETRTLHTRYTSTKTYYVFRGSEVVASAVATSDYTTDTTHVNTVLGIVWAESQYLDGALDYAFWHLRYIAIDPVITDTGLVGEVSGEVAVCATGRGPFTGYYKCPPAPGGSYKDLSMPAGVFYLVDTTGATLVAQDMEAGELCQFEQSPHGETANGHIAWDEKAEIGYVALPAKHESARKPYLVYRDKTSSAKKYAALSVPRAQNIHLS